ncbi:pentatricopeptide repeat-containing protein At3g63370, chloroplastic-like [Macadamia integrifolia]|uniref:pentatricopeptide repeat-containing protein At3g63370, chloroplastic-like n=1 Tax=Macadamia integrifolia TaxID=60698 RepID=UPI001C4F6191|nr:pentatricopeptide repeat-containing protein At3g63370, chloroplastic-like [Macadamia integrifolia]
MRSSRLPLALEVKSFLPFPNKHPNRHLNIAHQPQASKSSPSLPILVEKKDPIEFATVIAFCSKFKSIVLGHQIHGQIVKSGFSKDLFSQNNLIVMYSKCASLGCGLKLFDEMTERNVVSWTSLISGAIQNGEFEMGLEIYLDMIRAGLRPNEFALGSVLKSCASLEDLEFGLSCHCFAIKIGLENNYFVGGSVLNMYAKCGDIEAAKWVFEGMDSNDVGCWNAMIGGYALNGHYFEAMELVSLMHLKGIIMDQLTFINALNGCSDLGDLNFGRQIHAMIIRNQIEFSTSGMNSLIDMYFKTGGENSALKLFDKMGVKDIISWNTVFTGLFLDENAGEVASLFARMLSSGLKPNHVTFSIVFRLCGAVFNVVLGLQFYCVAYHLGFYNKALVVNSLINMFFTCGELGRAHSLFESTHTKDITTCNEMINGYNSNCCTQEALDMFCKFWELGYKANEFTFSSILGAFSRTEHQEIVRQIHSAIIKSGYGFHEFVCCSLINAYSRIQLLEDSVMAFNGIKRLDLASWGTMISAFVLRGHSYEALVLLNCLRETGKKPDEFILGSVLNSCSSMGAYHQTKCIHVLVIKTGFEKHVYVASAVIDAFAKCGDIESSILAFNQASRYDDLVLLNTMIMAYAHHGLVAEAFEIFENMKSANLKPTHPTFVAVISACSHLGLVEEGCRSFDSISSDHGMDPSAENFCCLVDLFSRNGLLGEAKRVIEEMPFAPWPAIWRSLLSGCRIHGNRELGEWAAQQLIQLAPENDAGYVLLSKVYSEEGTWGDASNVMRRMEERVSRKHPGYSWIEI